MSKKQGRWLHGWRPSWRIQANCTDIPHARLTITRCRLTVPKCPSLLPLLHSESIVIRPPHRLDDRFLQAEHPLS